MKKKVLLIGLLILVCVIAIISYVILNKEKTQNETITKLSDLTKTEKINIKKAQETIKVINNQTDVNNIVKEIIAGDKILDDETTSYVGESPYYLEMLDKNNYILETINLYPSSESLQRIKLKNLNENYYIDLNKVLEICDLKIS